MKVSPSKPVPSRGNGREAGRRVVLLADNTKYHRAVLHAPWREIQEPAFSLAFLPSYSPELHPFERLWKLVRRLCLHNRYFPELASPSIAAETEFAQWVLGSQPLVKLCSVG